MRRIFVSLSLLIAAQLTAGSVLAAEVKVAVASNFAATARALVKEYALVSHDSIRLLVGSTGKHTSQIQHGLRVDVFLAADSARPKLLEQSGHAVEGSRFTYATGRLALWSKDSLLVDAKGEILRSPDFKHLAIANPRTAPYGIAAKEVLSTLSIAPKLVYGESVGQAFQFASSGSAELALIAYSQVKNLNSGSYWLVPSELHQAIEQQAVLLSDSSASKKFIRFLKSEAALSLIASHGYLRPQTSGIF